MNRPVTHRPVRRAFRLSSSSVVVATLFGPVLLSNAALGQQVEFELGVEGSAATNSFQFSILIDGTLIGDYDAKTNPDGTSTRPGLFGGSGNNPIDCALTVTVGNDGATSVPTGSATFDLSDLESSQLVVDSLAIDLLAGGSDTVAGEILLVYETFNTINPFSIYPGGFEIPIPLAGAQVLRSEFDLVEPFTAVAGGEGGEVTFDTLLPVIWTVEFDAGTGVQVQEIPALLPFSGEITGEPGARALRFGGAASNAGSEPLEIPVPAVPLPLPTIPPGGTANLILEGTVTGVEFVTGLDVLVFGLESTPSLPGDLNGDGRINSADIGLLIAAWGTCSGCPADLDGNEVVNAADLGLQIADWTG